MTRKLLPLVLAAVVLVVLLFARKAKAAPAAGAAAAAGQGPLPEGGLTQGPSGAVWKSLAAAGPMKPRAGQGAPGSADWQPAVVGNAAAAAPRTMPIGSALSLASASGGVAKPVAYAIAPTPPPAPGSAPAALQERVAAFNEAAPYRGFEAGALLA